MKPSTDWTETIAPDEAARFDKLAATLAGIQKRQSPDRPARRALHAKAHAGLLGQIVVPSDVPDWAKVGIFATPQTLPAYVRFSNGSGGRQSDGEGDVRGIAVKVVGVPGKKLIAPLADAITQDFLAIQTESAPLRTPEEFVGLVVALSGSKLLALPRLLGVFGLSTFSMLRTITAGIRAPVRSMADLTLFSALPIRWGDYAVKYRFLPSHPETTSPAGPSRDALREELEARIKSQPLRYAMQIQGYLDAARTPIEDHTRPWDSPWVTVATLNIPAQDPGSERGQKLSAYVESLSFDPWHAPEAFRPLGAMMRARNAAYRDSVLARKAAPEPDGSEKI